MILATHNQSEPFLGHSVLKRMCRQVQVTIKELLGEQGAKQVKEDICVRKAADFIVDNAKEAKAAAKKTTKKEKAAEEKPEEA